MLRWCSKQGLYEGSLLQRLIMMKTKRTISLFVALILCLIGCEFSNASIEQTGDSSNDIDEITRISYCGENYSSSWLDADLPSRDLGVISIHTNIQASFINGPLDDIHSYAEGIEELSKPNDLIIEWSEQFSDCTFLLSDKVEFDNPTIFKTSNNYISITNLKINTNYYYLVMSEDSFVEKGFFTTSDEIIRNLNIPGVTNARDLGGYQINGGVVKQGMLFRTGRLNQNNVNPSEVSISQKGIDIMLNDFSVKTEIDLRMASDNEVGGLSEGVGVLGDGVSYYQCPMDYNVSLESEVNNASLKKVFRILGDKKSYPAFFHCSIGTDRTGYIAYLINGLLGVGKEDLWRDYLFSNFGNIGRGRAREDIANEYVRTIDETDGDCLKEKIENYLILRGIEKEHLEIIKETLVSPLVMNY